MFCVFHCSFCLEKLPVPLFHAYYCRMNASVGFHNLCYCFIKKRRKFRLVFFCAQKVLSFLLPLFTVRTLNNYSDENISVETIFFNCGFIHIQYEFDVIINEWMETIQHNLSFIAWSVFILSTVPIDSHDYQIWCFFF